MITLRNLYTVFGHDPQWSALATKCLQPMITIYLRKLGNTDITLITDFDLQMQVAMSPQPDDVKEKAQSCMNHLRDWAKQRGNAFAIPESEKPKEKVISKHPKRGEIQQPRRASDIQITQEEWQNDTRKRYGTIEKETASGGWKNGKRLFKDCWRTTIMVNGQRYHHRAKTRMECREWLRAVCEKRILPTDNKADWWRMEQYKDEQARIDELIVSAAEEANIVYEYRQTGDTEILYDYCIKALLPHMVYYCAHTLRMPQDRSLTCSRQAVGLILTKIVGGRPVTNITFTCKRMLRIYQNRGDFWYYDNAPEEVKLMVNRIDMSALTELYKITKDRRI